MSIIDNFRYYDIQFAIIGGLLISVASSLNLLLKGRITGMSGVFNGLITLDKSTFQWKLSFFLGMIFTSSLLFRIFSFRKIEKYNIQFFDNIDGMIGGLSIGGFALAGLLVGLGTKLGNGCTSGHGVCGLPRFSSRSWTAVTIFLTTGILVSTFRQSLPFSEQLFQTTPILNQIEDHKLQVFALSVLVLTLGAFIVQIILSDSQAKKIDLIVSFAIGGIFSAGLVMSGMLRRSKIIGFLTLNENWDPSLLFVLFSAVLLNIFTFNYIIHVQKTPLIDGKIDFPKPIIDSKLIIGAFLFGLGWGLGGLCPGPAMNLIPVYTFHICIVFLFALAVGQYLSKYLEQLLKIKK